MYAEKLKFKHILQIIGIFLAVFIVVNIGYFIYNFSEYTKINNVITKYKKSTIPNLREFTYNDCIDKYKDYYLADFYVASSAMSFLVGNQKYDYVNIEMIKNCLLMGARYLELQILNSSFDINSPPIVTTGFNKGQWQTSLNNINLELVLDTIANYAFNPELKTHQFPLFIYLKLQVNYPQTLSNIAKLLKKYFPSKGEKKMEAGNRVVSEIDPAKTKICSLFNQVIIWSDEVQTEGYNSDEKELIKEYTNVINKFPPVRMHYSKISSYQGDNTPKTLPEKRESSDLLTERNKVALTIVYPHTEKDSQTLNYDPDDGWSYGCQFVAINYQLDDEYRNVYLEKFKMDSVVLKPSGLLKEPDARPSQLSLDGLENSTDLPPALQKDVVKRQLSFLYKNMPVYFRPYNEPTKVFSIDNNQLVVKEKNDMEVDIEDCFIIKPNLRNKNDTLIISLESAKHPNKYLTYEGTDFIINDLRIKKMEKNYNEFVTNASFLPMKGLFITRSDTKEDSSETISLYLNGVKKELIGFNPISQTIINIMDESQNIQIANQSTFFINKLQIKLLSNLRQPNGKYVHQEKGLLISNSDDLKENGVFEFINENTLDNFPVTTGHFIHIKDYTGNYLGREKNNTLRFNNKKPIINTRFVVDESDSFIIITFAGDNANAPIIVQKDGIMRLAYKSEYDSPLTHFIIGTSYKKI
jgi:hypothetical protein